MTGRSFLDTNVLVYAADTDEPVKRQQAQQLLADDQARFAISTQVLGEFYVTVTRKLVTPLSASAARSAVSELGRLPTIATDVQLVQAAIDTSDRHQLSFWDALIIEAAVIAGCDTLQTEDLNAGATIRGIKIVNPFA